MTRIRFSEFAKTELNDACDWYERQQTGLGARFRRDVRESALQIAPASSRLINTRVIDPLE